MTKIAVIGLGWLGLPLAKSLVKSGFDVVGTTTSEAKLPTLRQTGLQAVKLDLDDAFPQLSTAIFENTGTCILNFPPGRGSEHTVHGQNCLKAIALFPPATRFIFVSSTGIYPDDIPLARETGFDRKTITGQNQLAYAEESLHRLLGDRLTIVRMAGLVGAGRHPARHIAGKTNLPNGNARVNLVHQADCIRIIEKIIEKNAWGELFNCCAGEHPSREAYYTWCCKTLGLDAPHFAPENAGNAGKIIDSTRSREVLEMTYRFDDPFDFVSGSGSFSSIE